MKTFLPVYTEQGAIAIDHNDPDLIRVISKSEIERTKDHIYFVEKVDDGEWQSIVPEPLAELGITWTCPNSAWYFLVELRNKQASGLSWKIGDNKACAQAMYNILSNVIINDDEEIESQFLHFNKDTPRTDVWHWIEEYFNICIGTDLIAPY